MKINIVLPNIHASGGIKIITQYAKHLMQVGHDVTLITCLYPNYSLKDRIKIKFGMKPSWAPNPSNINFDNLNVIYSKNPYKINKNDCPDADVIVATWWQTADWIKNFPASKGKKVYFIQGYEIFDSQPTKKVESTYLNSDFEKIVVSPWLKKIMEKNYHIKNVYEVYNGIDTQLYKPTKQNSYINNSIGMILSPLPCKGADLAIKTIHLLKKEIPNLQVNIISNYTPEKNGIYHLEKWMNYYKSPSIDDIRSIYSNSSCWLFPSREEGFGLPILESLACGTPVVAFNAGAAEAIINDNVGSCLPNHSLTKMTLQAIKWIHKKNNRMNEVSENCIKHVQQWSSQNSSINFEKVLSHIVS